VKVCSVYSCIFVYCDLLHIQLSLGQTYGYMECMYVYMYVCMYVRMYVCMYVRMYVLMYVCICVYMYVCICVYMYVCMYLCIYVCVEQFQASFTQGQAGHIWLWGRVLDIPTIVCAFGFTDIRRQAKGICKWGKTPLDLST
jgi:hypothetical protein